MIKNSKPVSVTLAILAAVAVTSSLVWADSKPKVDSRAQQIDSMLSRMDSLEERIEKLEAIRATSNAGPGGASNPISLADRVTALERRLEPQFVPATQ